MKKYLEYIKIIRSDKRKSAIASLFIWLLFFICVFSLVGRAPKNLTINDYSNVEDKNEKNENNYNTITSYEVNYLVETNINKYVITSTFYNEKYYYTYDNNNYYLDNDILYYVDDINRQLKKVNVNSNSVFDIIDIKQLTKDSIQTIIESSEEESKTTYKDGTIVKNYIYTTFDNRKMYINTTEKDGIINNVVIDYKDYFNTNYTIFKVTCSYQNINNILEYNRNYNSYQKIGGE